MTVEQLIEVLNKIEDKSIPVMFSYDSRVCCMLVTCVDLVPNNDQDQRMSAADFISSGTEQTPTQAVVLRSEDKEEYDYHRRSDNEYKGDITLFLE